VYDSLSGQDERRWMDVCGNPLGFQSGLNHLRLGRGSGLINDLRLLARVERGPLIHKIGPAIGTHGDSGIILRLAIRAPRHGNSPSWDRPKFTSAVETKNTARMGAAIPTE